jgi:hypothetical protein
VFTDCCEWNLEGGYLPDGAACLLNIGSILKATGEEAVFLLKDDPQHPLLARAVALLTPDSSDA